MTSKFFYVKVAAVLLLLAAIIFGTVMGTPTTTPAPSATPTANSDHTTPAPTATPTPCPVVTGRPKAIPTTVDLPEPGKYWEPVNKTWLEFSIEKWGKGDINDSTYSYHSPAEVYKDQNGVYFRLYNFRVYLFEGGNWLRTEVFPLFEGKIVIGEGPRFLVLDEKSVEVWEVDYSPDSATWTFSRLFAAVADTPENIRVFGDWAFEDSASKAYIASNESGEIWTVSRYGITAQTYDQVVFSSDSIFIVEGTDLIRVAYEAKLRFETGSGFTSVNESELEGGVTIIDIGDDIFEPVTIVGSSIHEKDGRVYAQEGIGKIFID